MSLRGTMRGGRGSDRDQDNRECYNCKRTGHLKHDCPLAFKEHSIRRSRNSTGSNRYSPRVYRNQSIVTSSEVQNASNDQQTHNIQNDPANEDAPSREPTMLEVNTSETVNKPEETSENPESSSTAQLSEAASTIDVAPQSGVSEVHSENNLTDWEEHASEEGTLIPGRRETIQANAMRAVNSVQTPVVRTVSVNLVQLLRDCEVRNRRLSNRIQDLNKVIETSDNLTRRFAVQRETVANATIDGFGNPRAHVFSASTRPSSQTMKQQQLNEDMMRRSFAASMSYMPIHPMYGFGAPSMPMGPFMMPQVPFMMPQVPFMMPQAPFMPPFEASAGFQHPIESYVNYQNPASYGQDAQNSFGDSNARSTPQRRSCLAKYPVDSTAVAAPRFG